MNDRDIRFRCVELAAAMFVNSPGLDVVQTADKLFLYVSAGNSSAEEDPLSGFNEGKGC